MSSSILLTDVLPILQRLQKDTGLLRDIKPSGNNILCTCPFHKGGQEKKPSMGVLKSDTRRNGKLYKKGTYNCFTCDATGSIEELVSRMFGKEDGGYYGQKYISKNFVSVEVNQREKLELNLSRGKKSDIIKYVGEEELDSYRWNHPYHKQRGLSDRVIEYFDIGYDKETNTMTMPVRDYTGGTVFVYRRSVEKKFFNNEKGTPRGLYIYGMYEVMKNVHKIDELMVCEAPIDALSAWSNGKYAIATFTAQLTPVQIGIIKQIPVRKLISAYDNDEAGNKATDKLFRLIGGNKIKYRLKFPQYAKDLNDIKTEDWEQLRSGLYIKST